ncbi:MAG: DNA recombination protein RmuC, partial [Methylobacter sp.]|nr:DNA recombination protein RmuC [Methylobacter sp.]
MNFINNIPPLIWALTGLLIGAFLTRLLNGKDKILIRQLSTDLAVLEEKLKQFQNRETEFNRLQQLFIDTKTQNTELQTRIDEQAKNTAEKLKLLLDAELRLNTQFENLAGKIFDDRSKQFTEHHKTSLDHIVTPLREQLGEFKQRIETVYDNENKDRISLREEIVSLRRDTAQMNQEALNLTRALKGDKKAQGNWGEMILEKVLEKSG